MPGPTSYPREDFVAMAVPHRLLLGRQRSKKLLVDDVLDVHDLCGLRVSIEDNALDNILIQD